MTVSIGKNEATGVGQVEPRAAVTGQEASKKTESASQPRNEEAAALDVSSPSRGAQLVEVNNVASTLSIAKDALSSIEKLRSRQSDLAKQAESSSDGAEREELDRQFQDLEKQIGEVVAGATFNEESALSDRTFEVKADRIGIEESIKVAGGEQAASRLDENLKTGEGARNASFAVRDKLDAIGSAKQGFEAASRKADGFLEGVSRQSGASSTSSEGASDLVKRIATDLGSRQSSDNRPAKDLIAGVANNLTPQRVNELLRI